MEKSELHKIFIGGLPRSGTTLVQNLLDAHPLIYGGAEFDRIPNIVDLRNKLQRSWKQERIRSYTTPEEIDASIADFILKMIRPQEMEPSITTISEKTPWNVLFFEELLELFPKAKFILVLRNPLDVFNSMKSVAKRSKLKGITPPDFTTDVRLAVAYMEAVYKLGESLSHRFPSRIISVRYEDLITELESEAKKIFSFLEQPWYSEVLNFHEMDHPGEKTMTKNNVWYTKKEFNRNPNEPQEPKKNLLSYMEKQFLVYRLRKDQFINPDYLYFKEPSTLGKIIGNFFSIKYNKKYRFKKTPKRVLN